MVKARRDPRRLPWPWERLGEHNKIQTPTGLRAEVANPEVQRSLDFISVWISELMRVYAIDARLVAKHAQAALYPTYLQPLDWIGK